MITEQMLPMLSPNQQAWLLFNISDITPLAKIYKNGHSPIFSWLYENTLLDEQKNKGPLLLNVTNTPILADYQKAPENWTAFLIYTPYTIEQHTLLTHLRKLLTIHVNEEELGILNYCDTRVACCFFKMPQEQLAQWLGPIDNLTWFGGDFIAIANDQQYLQTVKNPLPLHERVELPGNPLLTTEQKQLLEECQEQQYLLQWSKTVNIDFLNAWQSYQEGIQQSFTEDHLETFIKLRVNNRQQPLPETYPDHIATQAQKIEFLQQYWVKATA